MSDDNREDEAGPFRRSPTGPSVAPPRAPISQPSAQPFPLVRTNKRRFWSVVIFILLISGVGIRAYRDLSRPEAWSYWKESYLSPRMTSKLINPEGSGDGRRALAVSGEIGAASANWFRQRIDEAHLSAGDTVLLSSPGGELNQAVIMGEIVRSRGLATAVGVVDASGYVRPAHCASACVIVFAGGKPRYGVKGSMLGVHQFEATAPMRDPVADTQRVAGMLLGYMTRMGVSSAVVEAMSKTSEIRWLGTKEALAMNLITEPVDGP